LSPTPRGLDLDRLRKAAAPPPTGTTHDATGPTGTVHEGPAGAPALVAKERRVQAILDNIESLPSLPSVVLQTLRLANDDRASASDFEEIIRKDQVLTARVLKLVNSPFFGLRSKVQTIPQAIVVLGLKSLKSVVLAAKTSKLLNGQLGPYGYQPGGLWQHSMACATLSRMIARVAGLGAEAQEELFVAGLLHDVGKLVLSPHVKSLRSELEAVRRDAEQIVDAEIAVIGMSHPDAGGRMGRKWGLPDALVELIERHHDGPEGASTERLVVQVANDHCKRAGVGLKGGTRKPEADAEARLAALGLAGSEAELTVEVGARLEELRPILQDMAGGGA
jgi:putative nucleotidyltransferase with HDIG domain